VTATVVDVGDDLPLTVGRLLKERTGPYGDQALLVCDEDTLSYARADEQSAEAAKGLLALGAGPGTHVGLLHPNGPEFVVGWLAIARIGAVAVPLSTFSTGTELATLLKNADVEILLSTHSFRGHNYVDDLREALPETDLESSPFFALSVPSLRHVYFDLQALYVEGAEIGDDLLASAEAAIAPSDRMVIVYTSGSTSEPKGVIHQHGPLIRHIDNLNELRRYGNKEILFSNSPFFWIGGFAYGLLGTMVAGATLVCSVSPDPTVTLDLLERTRPTMVNGFAASVAHLANDPSFGGRDLSSIRRGNLWPIMPADVAPADPDLRHNMLGMTEAGSVCLATGDESDQPEHRRGSFGQPVPGFETMLVDPESENDCDVGEIGELWLRGPFLMEGYYGRERHETFTPDGWYRTGDLFHVDAEGFHYFHGRRGDMIKTAGANVAPREVEAAILDETGLIAHVIALDDEQRGQAVAVALRVPRGTETPDVEDLRQRLRKRLSAYKVPRRFLVLADEDVPMLSSGKLDTRALRELFDDE